MSGPTEYPCNEKVIALLERSNLSLHALRLLHACYYYIDQDPFWRLSLMHTPHAKTCRVDCAELKLATGTRGANDNDMLREGVPELLERGFFDVGTYAKGSHTLEFRFSRQFLSAGQRYKKSRFAMVDTAHIASLRSASYVLFYTRARQVEQAKFPFFNLPGIDPVSSPWTTERRRHWHRAACTVSCLLGHDYLFIPEPDERNEHIARVRVKLSAPASRWSAGKLYPRYAREPVSVVTAGKAKILKKAELRRRLMWRSV